MAIFILVENEYRIVPNHLMKPPMSIFTMFGRGRLITKWVTDVLSQNSGRKINGRHVYNIFDPSILEIDLCTLGYVYIIFQKDTYIPLGGFIQI